MVLLAVAGRRAPPQRASARRPRGKSYDSTTKTVAHAHIGRCTAFFSTRSGLCRSCWCRAREARVRVPTQNISQGAARN